MIVSERKRVVGFKAIFYELAYWLALFMFLEHKKGFFDDKIIYTREGLLRWEIIKQKAGDELIE